MLPIFQDQHSFSDFPDLHYKQLLGSWAFTQFLTQSLLISQIDVSQRPDAAGATSPGVILLDVAKCPWVPRECQLYRSGQVYSFLWVWDNELTEEGFIGNFLLNEVFQTIAKNHFCSPWKVSRQDIYAASLGCVHVTCPTIPLDLPSLFCFNICGSFGSLYPPVSYFLTPGTKNYHPTVFFPPTLCRYTLMSCFW